MAKFLDRRFRTGLTAVGALVALLALAPTAHAQGFTASPTPAAPAAPAPMTAPPSGTRPGLFQEIGKMIDNSASFILPRAADAPAEPAAPAPASAAPPVAGAAEAASPGLADRAVGAATDVAKGALSAVGAAASAARDAAGAVTVPPTQVVTGRAVCATAQNGAPDCQPAAISLCQAKGLAGGRSVSIESAQKCPIWAQWPGRHKEPGECAVQSFVTQAVCQMKL